MGQETLTFLEAIFDLLEASENALARHDQAMKLAFREGASQYVINLGNSEAMPLRNAIVNMRNILDKLEKGLGDSK